MGEEGAMSKTTYEPTQSGMCSRIGCRKSAIVRSSSGANFLCLNHFGSWFKWYSRWMRNSHVIIYQEWWSEICNDPLLLRERWQRVPVWHQIAMAI